MWHTKMYCSAKCNSGRIAIQWFHIKHYSDYQYTKIQPNTFSGSKNVSFCTIRDFGSPTFTMDKLVRGTLARFRRTSNRTIVPTIVTKV